MRHGVIASFTFKHNYALLCIYFYLVKRDNNVEKNLVVQWIEHASLNPVNRVGFPRRLGKYCLRPVQPHALRLLGGCKGKVRARYWH